MVHSLKVVRGRMRSYLVVISTKAIIEFARGYGNQTVDLKRDLRPIVGLKKPI